jgi:methionyl-tRNA formyltransferase
LKVAFAGTPDFAATVLRGLHASKHEIGLVISQPDARRDRGRRPSPTPVAQLARASGLPLRQPTRIAEAAEEISDHDALVVAAYGQILTPDTLYAAPHGAYNVHASLLPAYRGPAPIERAIMAGEGETGVTIMLMDEGLDTGPIALQRKVPITPQTTGGDLADLLADIGSNSMIEVLTSLERSSLTLKEQDSLYATYAPKISREERVIRWEVGAGEVHDLVRALAPHIGARTYHAEVDGPIKILESKIPEKEILSLSPGEIYAAKRQILVGCGYGVLRVLRLQFPGAKPLSTAQFLLGNTIEGSFGV